jgi:cathepsin C
MDSNFGPDFVQDVDTGRAGTWTMIYDQGFEIELGDYKFFAFFNFTQKGDDVTSNCGETFTGWYHRKGLLAPRFGCFRAKQIKGDPSVSKQHVYSVDNHKVVSARKNIVFEDNYDMIKTINSVQSSWVAGPATYIKTGTTMEDVRKMTGAKQVHKFRSEARKRHMAMMRPKQTAPVSSDLPKAFDWRNVDGVNYVSPVRDQGNCGSCYSFAATAMYEARLRVQSKRSRTTIFSPQDIVNCGPYSQGCDGGFAYLVSKYGEDYGIASELYIPYTGNQTQCTAKDYSKYARTYTSNYWYVGPDGTKAYYGATTEEGMMRNILEKGPIATSFEVYADFMHYKSGIYSHVAETDKFNAPDPKFVITNHVVLIVGWGEQNGVKYWIVKNSWSEKFGIDGYFWIKKGVDEVGIESEVSSVDIVADYNY